MINVLSINTFNFRNHKRKETKEIIIAKSTLFTEPVMLTSDLHTYGLNVFQILQEHIHLDKFIVLSVGDMAGNGELGADADPTILYTFLKENCKMHYYVQGNHDFESLSTIENNISDGSIVESSLGIIGGINGIISKKEKLYRVMEKDYFSYLSNMKNKNIKYLLTHEAPELPVVDPSTGNNCIGNKKFYQELLKYKSDLIHIYGHCNHSEFYHKISNIHFINADSRVIIIIPENYNPEEFIKKEIETLYF